MRPICTLICLGSLLLTSRIALAQQGYEDDLEAEAEGYSFEEEEETARPAKETRVEEPAAEPEPTPPPDPPNTSKGYTFGLRVGGGYNRLIRPEDPEGSPTLLYGSPFAGPTFQLGLQAGMPLTHVAQGRVTLGLDLGLAYSYMRGMGYVENAARTQRQSVTLTGHTLRLPLFLMLRSSPEARIGVRAGIGPEFLVGLASGATVHYENIDDAPEALQTTPVTHVAIGSLLGIAYQLSNVSIPLEVRFSWDPQVGNSTQTRFEDYQSFDEPGKYQLAFNLHLHFLTGVEWRF